MAKVKQNKKSPQRELFSEFLNSRQRKEMRDVFKYLKQEAIDETCKSLLIYLRYKRYPQDENLLFGQLFLMGIHILTKED